MEEKGNEVFWNARIEDLKNGYVKDEEKLTCLICNETFECGRIYSVEENFYDAKKTVEHHIKEKHSSMLEYLLNMNSSFTGISEIQKSVLKLMAAGVSDKEIATMLSLAPSTIRNHRYKLREKEKQAKLFLTMMELLAENTNKKITKLEKADICDAHKSATTLDDRFNITDKEKAEVIKNYINTNGSLKNYPSKEKKKIIVLEVIKANFQKDKVYSEKEVNRILSRIYEDYATIRRALIEYGFLDRSNDCGSYWVKE
ncbi:hypothetical protein SAMN02745163_01730 [Clostridium cavendishii DSM 21758]|uniref:HTH luxR-type domain-containing protein n=1 Tax=Clostridium cavendishii DSM 21758 TaxID=1121302 RepID=A0A1M6I8H9_9CLOT|nr:DUF2087 domain-containing protein [Clostridium cavendishii]SHJ30799.1 hypothetical protein SAMN02745163_01730 [Clostridium cavendishii DSM 21758]